MNEGTARRLVIVSMVVVGGVVTYDLLRGQQSAKPGAAFKVVWSIGVLFLLLVIGADIIPALAGPFAGLIALAVLIGRSAALDEIARVIPSKGGVAT